MYFGSQPIRNYVHSRYKVSNFVPVHKQSGSRSSRFWRKSSLQVLVVSEDTFDLSRMTSRSTAWTRSSFVNKYSVRITIIKWYGRTFILSIVIVFCSDFHQCQPHPRWVRRPTRRQPREYTNPDSRDSKEYPGGMNSFHYAEGLIDGTKKDA